MFLPSDLWVEIFMWHLNSDEFMPQPTPTTLLLTMISLRRTCKSWKQIIDFHPLIRKYILRILKWEEPGISLSTTKLLDPLNYLRLEFGSIDSNTDLTWDARTITLHGINYIVNDLIETVEYVGSYIYVLYRSGFGEILFITTNPKPTPIYTLCGYDKCMCLPGGILYTCSDSYYFFDVERLTVRRLRSIRIERKLDTTICRETRLISNDKSIIDPWKDEIIWTEPKAQRVRCIGYGLVMVEFTDKYEVCDIYTGVGLTEIVTGNFMIQGVKQNPSGYKILYKDTPSKGFRLIRFLGWG